MCKQPLIIKGFITKLDNSIDNNQYDNLYFIRGVGSGFPKSKRLHKQRTGEDDRSKLSGDGEEHTSKELIIKKITVLEGMWFIFK